MKSTIYLAVASAICLNSWNLQAQVCDPTSTPTGLSSTVAPGAGVLLQWDAVPGSVGVQLRVDLPDGTNIRRKIVGLERDLFLVSETFLSPGNYTWRVQAACSTIPPFYDATFISAPNSFTIGGTTSCPTTVTDVDGNVYNTVQIGTQCWMKENLKVEHYRNGDNIPTGLSDSAWGTTTSGAFSVYDNVAANKATYGLLYNWYAAEWTELTDFLGGESVAGGAMKTTGTLEAGSGLWSEPNTGATNSSGFSGLPGGYRNDTPGFFKQGNWGFWWSSSNTSTGGTWIRRLDWNDGDVLRGGSLRLNGFSVRCLKN